MSEMCMKDVKTYNKQPVFLSLFNINMLNSSKIVLDSLTFKDLNLLIDQCSLDIQENYNTFYLQASEMNKLFFDTCNYHEHLEMLHRRVILAKCFQGQVDLNIELTRASQNQIENGLLELERNVLCCCKNCPQDVYRKNTYEISEQIDTMLSNLEQAMQIWESKIFLTTDSSAGNFDIEGFTAVLRYSCGQLENIELKTHRLRDALAEIAFHKQQALRLLHLKE